MAASNYQVRNVDNAASLKPDSVDFPHTDEGEAEALEIGRSRSLSGAAQVVLNLATEPETVIARFEDGHQVEPALRAAG
jgi:hypothetical protein